MDAIRFGTEKQDFFMQVLGAAGKWDRNPDGVAFSPRFKLESCGTKTVG